MDMLVCQSKLLTGGSASIGNEVVRQIDLFSDDDIGTLEESVISVGDNRDDGNIATMGNDDVAFLEFVDLAVGGVLSLGEDLDQLSLFQHRRALIHKCHTPGFTVGLDRAEETHEKTEEGAAEGLLSTDNTQLSRKYHEAGEDVVQKVEVIPVAAMNL